MENKGFLVVISGPSGSGKGTVRKVLMQEESFAFSVSDTSRAPREGERDGVDYHYISRETFEKNIRDGKMLEYTQYNGNYYGTPLCEVERALKAGKNILLELEVEGAMNVKRHYPEAVLIMLLPPSFSVQAKRLRGRATESEEVVLGRLERTRTELTYLPHYDYVVYNREVEQCAEDIRTVLRAERFAVRHYPEVPVTYFEN